ncbi:cation-translocating P-type ATPase [Corynebacterium sp.]|uniref:heavy metal translocating P-type ATPase n=1 Tax=Corynebacterium sp. TaxID=1720 RepID=UPI0026DD75A2|nr:cation-translocating P-type ATPase [Corynebacterium sp.]
MFKRVAVSGVAIALALVLEHATNASAMYSDGLMIVAAIIAGLPILISAIRALKVKNISIDLLVSIAAIGAIFVGNYWEAAAVTFLFALGHALETRTMNKTRAALSELIEVAPETATVIRDGQQIEVDPGQVQPEEIVVVKPGATVPVDGVVRTGVATINEASITGESIPAEKGEGDQVYAGTVSTSGAIHVEATGIGSDTTLARIIRRVEDAQDAKAKTQTFLERFSTWYTPAIIVLALVTGLITRDVTLALTLLVVGCPGALVISIPVAIVAGIGRGARSGLLIKGGEYLETAARIDAVALDKTGTLTSGTPQLVDVLVPATVPGTPKDEVLRLAAAIETYSEHPLAGPIVEFADGTPATDVEPITGRGIVGTVEGKRVAVGNRSLLNDDHLLDIAAEQEQLGRTAMFVTVDGRGVGVISVADSIREDAKEMVDELHAAGVKKVVMLTGDAQRVAEAVAREVGIDEVHAGLLPEDKQAVIEKLQEDGYTVGMVGDGVNDAPALATANTGIAMGAAGTSVAIETADIALMRDDMLALPQAIRLAKKTVRIMRQNIVVSLLTVVALMAGIFAGDVTMAIGMLVHEASVLLVIVNAMRLLRA